MKLPVSVLPIELLMTTPLYVLPATTRFERVLLFAWSLISMPKVPLPTTRARPLATWRPMTSLVKVLLLPLSSRIPPPLKPVISSPLIVLLCESSSSEKPTAPPPAWRAVDLDDRPAGVARLRGPVDDRRVGERRQRSDQRDRLGAAGRDVEVDRRDRADGGVVGGDDRGPERAGRGVVVVAAVVVGGHVERRQELAALECLERDPAATAPRALSGVVDSAAWKQGSDHVAGPHLGADREPAARARGEHRPSPAQLSRADHGSRRPDRLGGWVAAASELAAAVRSRVCQGIANGVRIATTTTYFSSGARDPAALGEPHRGSGDVRRGFS